MTSASAINIHLSTGTEIGALGACALWISATVAAQSGETDVINGWVSPVVQVPLDGGRLDINEAIEATKDMVWDAMAAAEMLAERVDVVIDGWDDVRWIDGDGVVILSARLAA